MYEEDDEQNGMQGNQPTAARIANLFRIPQSGEQDDGEFVNRGLALQVDPVTRGAYQTSLIATGGTPAQTAVTQNGSAQGPAYVPPIQPRDAQGKTLPKYRMGVGQRILATVANFANGFAGNRTTPIYVGPGALNNRYYRDEALRQQQNEESFPHTTKARDAGTTSPEAAPDDLTSSKLMLRGNPRNGRFMTSAQRRAPGSLPAPARNSYAYSAFNPQTGQRVFSNDGVNWYDKNGSGVRQA